MDLDAVQSDEQAATEELERGKGASLADSVEAGREQVGEAIGGQPIEQIPDSVVTRDGLHTNECVAMGTGLFPLHAAQEPQTARSLEKEHREGAGSGIDEGNGIVAAPAIGQGRGGLA